MTPTNSWTQNGQWWDVAPAPVNVLVMTDGEPVTVTSGSPSSPGIDRHWEFEFDPDGDGIFPGSLMLDITYPYPITDRVFAPGGAISAAAQPAQARIDLDLQTWDAAGNPIDQSSGIAWANGGAPAGFSGGGTTASWNNRSNAGRFYGLGNGGMSLTTFPHTPFPSPSASISRQKLTFSDLQGRNGGTMFRVSFDGGVPVNIIPEPSRALLVAIAGLILATRRRR